SDCHLPLFGGIRVTNSTPAAIPDDDAAGVTRSVSVSGFGSVRDVDCEVSFTHSRMSDVTIELSSPLGTTVTLQSGSLAYGGSMTARYDDVLTPGVNDRFGDRSTSGPGRLSDFDGERFAGTWTLRVVDDQPLEVGELLSWSLSICPQSTAIPIPSFIRADANEDGSVNLADAVSVLSALFAGGSLPPCVSAADVNDDGQVDVGDPIYLLTTLFGLGPDVPPPSPNCGPDPTQDLLACLVSTAPCP
ncbi:MAG: proprotein convertase P-domain-containing protein, partial [Planctomycetes bacterium]|nr:proprotein convertase P-domain-containing protein [Planctomycetota bacterium]